MICLNFKYFLDYWSLAGDFGFDPLGLGEDPESLRWYVQAELVHARFAMAGVAGILFTDVSEIKHTLPGQTKLHLLPSLYPNISHLMVFWYYWIVEHWLLKIKYVKSRANTEHNNLTEHARKMALAIGIRICSSQEYIWVQQLFIEFEDYPLV